MSNWMTGFGFLALAVVLTLGSCSEPPTDRDVPVRNDQEVSLADILTVGHGRLISDDGALDYDEGDIVRLQSELLNRMIDGVSIERRRKADGILDRARADGLGARDIMVIGDLLIAWLIDSANREARVRFFPYVAMLHVPAEVLLGSLVPPYAQGHPFLHNYVDLEIVQAHALVFPMPQPNFAPASYENRCKNLGVPVPPPVSDPEWTEISAFNGSLFIPSDLVKLRGYSDGPGRVCMSLERQENVEGALETSVVGVICQNNATGDACYWNRTGRTATEERMPEFVNADAVHENCTDCHRGENAFIFFPGTPLDPAIAPSGVSFDVVSAFWSRPLSLNPDWFNPGPAATEGICAVCHDLPGVERRGELAGRQNYCGFLRWAANERMPPQQPAGEAALWLAHPDLAASCDE